MDPIRLVGSALMRCAALLFAGACAAAAVHQLAWLAIASGVLAFISLIHSFSSLYTAWLAFAEVARVAVITVLFGACYLLVVPVFRLVTLFSDPLLLRNRSRAETFWSERLDDSDPGSLERMA